MSAHNRVIWSEGLFLQPQHFQQQDRYFERYVETRCAPLAPYSWGFTEMEFERDFLKIGKIGLRRVAGVFPDGTPFRMPDDDPLPPPIDIGGDVRDERMLPGAAAAPLGRSRRGAAALGRRTGAPRDSRVRGAPMPPSGGDPATLEVGGAANAAAGRSATSPRPTPASRSRAWSSVARISRSCSTTASSRPSCTCGPRPGWRR